MIKKKRNQKIDENVDDHDRCAEEKSVGLVRVRGTGKTSNNGDDGSFF
jgi:hypothetical protein